MAEAADLARSLLDLQATLGRIAAVPRVATAPECGPLCEADRLAILEN